MGTVAHFKPRKGSTAAKRMMAAVRAGKSPKRHLSSVTTGGKKKRRSKVSAAVTKARRTVRKHTSRSMRLSMSGITAMAKNAAVGAAGAVAVDVAFGYIKQYLPTSMQTAQDMSTGGLNPQYFLAKAAAALAVGVIGGKFTKLAAPMAEGALVVNAYEIIKQMVPASIQMGQYVSPARPNNVVAMNGVPRRLPAVASRGMGQYIPASIREGMQDSRS